ncbi:unnamed protein product [Plutella xylostella]|uniref:Protein SERAC1 n=1 Tax=Plutella xylostella TaxID=51655 RepID=A0A8S4G926_PLUXY|nr:unnamed protein product [Plutella xylostella]
MSIRDKIQPVLKILKITSLVTGTGLFIAYEISNTRKYINKVINPTVLDREKKYVPEYVYIEDPTYNTQLEKLQEKESFNVMGFGRIWKSLQHSLAWRLLWLCKHGSAKQRNVALERLAGFSNNKDWDCRKLAQALDGGTAVLLARTRGADLRYFLPPPIHVRRAAATKELLSHKLGHMILATYNTQPHVCINHFLFKYFVTVHVHPDNVEVDSVPPKPDVISEKDLCILCLDAIHHHVSLFHNALYEDDFAIKSLIYMGILPCIAELLLRYPNDLEIDLAVVRLLAVLSLHQQHLKDFFQNGLIGYLAAYLKSDDVRLASSAAVALTNLSGECKYMPGLFILHPIYRSNQPVTCDTLLVHGLRGGVFVTWRQRDRKCGEPLGLADATVSDVECNTIEESSAMRVADPEYREILEDLRVLEEESLLTDMEIVLQDLPIRAQREPAHTGMYTVKNKQAALSEELQDKARYSFCWPKDWLPQDCGGLRILGVNYWSSLSEWLERCPLQTAEISRRAGELAPALVAAAVGRADTPVVWLAHSMGGLIVKQLLTCAADDADPCYKKLSENTRAVLFYSTPHRGTALASMPRAAAAFLWPSNDVRQLQRNSPVLLQLHQKFLNKADAHNWETISFAETKPTLVTAFKVPIHFVDSTSADLGRGVFYEMPLDHLSICKPATRQSILYTTVLDVIQRTTARQEHTQYSYIMNKIMYLLQKYLARRAGGGQPAEGARGEELRWFENILLDAFSKGFVD